MEEKEKFEEAKRLYKDANADQRYVLERLFPQLIESEGDKIRKEIIKYFKRYSGGDDVSIKFPEWIAWLEKQGESKSIDMSIKEKAHKIAWETSKHYDPNACKQEWCEMAALDMASWFEKQRKHASAWSEEDEKIRREIIRIVDIWTSSSPVVNGIPSETLLVWLEKQRKHASAWSEEDERLIQIIIDILNRENHLGHISHTDLIACVRKLKSLKPHSTWKPSESKLKPSKKLREE